MKLLKGVTVSILLFLLCIVAPFNIHAAGETQIVPTYTSSTTQQQWQTKIRITNYCEGTNASTASCKLQFYVTGNYYGIIYVDGYDSSNTHWLNGTSVFISDGYGEYNYNFYQNGIKAISSISIWAVALVVPDSNVDLTQIIQLLTSINAYNQQMVGNQSQQIQQLQTVINDLIVSNGYLETLTKMRQWNFPIESFTAVYPFFLKYNPSDIVLYNSYSYPLFNVSANDVMFNSLYTNSNYYDTTLIFGIDELIYDSNFDTILTPTNSNYTRSVPETISRVLISTNPNVWYQIVRIDFHYTGSGTQSFGIQFNKSFKILPIYWNLKRNSYLSTDFALQYGLSNRLLDDLDIIANGTSASNQQASDLSSGTDSMQQQMNNFTAQEDSYNLQMNNSINAIDFTSPVSQNAGIIPAANFVISIFNGLIQNNAFSVLILIVCVLIIGKKVIGK